MKKMMAAVLCLALLAALIPASAATVSEVMRVYNCQEWVSLREDPSTSSKRLAKVHYGELVTDCVAFDDFIQCDYNGKTGYILQKYLQRTSFSRYDDILPNQMVVNVSEFASMLNKPSSSGRRVTTVPVGAVVTSCVKEGAYVYCDYLGNTGYISAGYLYRANYSVTSQDESVVSKYSGLYPAVSGTMQVVNCEEWVSLRERASTSAARLVRVPLGALVDSCLQVSDTFIYCTYQGVWGYIQAAYLSPAGESGSGSAALTFEALPEYASYAAFSAIGTLEEEFWAGADRARRVSVRRQTAGDTETLCAAVFQGNTMIGRVLYSSRGVSELPALTAFAGGTADQRTLLFFDGDRLSCYEIGEQMEERVLWVLPLANVGGGAVHLVDGDGSIYLIGYYTGLLTKISPDGVLLWQTGHSDENVYWPQEITADGDLVRVRFAENGSHDGTGAVLSFSKEDGSEAQAQPPAAPVSASPVVIAQFAKDARPGDHISFIASEEEPVSEVVYSVSGGSVRQFRVLSVDLVFTDDGFTYSDETLYTLDELTPDMPLMVTLTFLGDTPNNGFGYTDETGRTRRFVLDISGEDGSLFFSEY